MYYLNQQQALSWSLPQCCTAAYVHAAAWNGYCRISFWELTSSSSAFLIAAQESLSSAIHANEALRPCLPRLADDLNPLRALSLFERITDEDCGVLDLTGAGDAASCVQLCCAF